MHVVRSLNTSLRITPYEAGRTSLELALIGASLAIAVAVGLVHFYDRFSRRGMYRVGLARAATAIDFARASSERLEAIAAMVPRAEMALGRTETALNGLASFPDVSAALLGLDKRLSSILSVLTRSTEEAQEAVAAFGAFPPEIAGSLGGTVTQSKAMAREVSARLGADMLGAYGGLIQQFAPSLYDWLVEHPERIIETMEMPFVKRILGRVQAFAASVTGKEPDRGGGVDWGRIP